MHAIEPAEWTDRLSELWRRIGAHAFEHPGQALDFTRRLARDRGWSLAYARGAVAEYRRFCFLAMVGPGPATPSEEIDEVWHQHLTYSRDYWEAWCGRALGGALHHDPTAGGPAEGARYRAQYAETLARYEAYFGPPDPAYWPATHRRFGAQPRYRIVDRDRTLVLPRPSWPGGRAGRALLALAAALAAILAPRPAQALPLNPYDWPATPFLTLYGALCAGVIAYALLERGAVAAASGRVAARPEAAADRLGLVQIAWLGGGRQRACDLVLAGLVEAGAARIAGPGGRPEIEVADGGRALPEPFAAFRGLARGGLSRAAFGQALAPALAPLAEDLRRRGLVPAAEVIARARLRIAAAAGAVVGFGVIRIILGTARDRPVGYLVLLTGATLVIAAVAALAMPGRTRLGAAVLRLYRERHSRAASAPRGHELLFAFALGGTAVLAGTHLADLGRLVGADRGGGGGDGGSTGGDGGGCGGGCGGCGGGD